MSAVPQIELLGMGGLGSGRCEGNAIALEDSVVCAMPYALIEKIGRDVPSLQRRLHAVLALEIVRVHGIMMLLGSMGARRRDRRAPGGEIRAPAWGCSAAKGPKNLAR